jgi:carboxyl-terminal processing protease
LVSAKTFSAAEMTADAFKGSGRATLVGEKTLGRMLSQKMYDLPEGLQLSLPIADYYSLDAGRIEGVGVTPHVTTAAADALDFALAKLGDEK